MPIKLIPKVYPKPKPFEFEPWFSLTQPVLEVSAAPATDKIAFIARTAYSSVSKVSTVSKASIGKISGVLAK